jgi:acetoin utilization deacetylase AcuC-like enzyme
MANYLARIELHHAGPEDYERLHSSMQQRGYERKIAGEDGVMYQLPTGTYFVSGTSAVLSIALNAAVDAADETGKKSAVFVTDWQLARWHGLAND